MRVELRKMQHVPDESLHSQRQRLGTALKRLSDAGQEGSAGAPQAPTGTRLRALSGSRMSSNETPMP